MSEVIQIGVGGAGCKIGLSFIEELISEHEICVYIYIYIYIYLAKDGNSIYPIYPENNLLNDNKETFFNEIQTKNPTPKYTPRAILIDTDPYTLDNIKSSNNISQILDPSNYINGTESTGNNWAMGSQIMFYEMKSMIIDSIRGEVEKCDLTPTFQIYCSICGGAGSGIMSKLLQEVLPDFGTSWRILYAIFPSPTVSDIVTESYNSAHALSEFKKHNVAVIPILNECLFKLNSNRDTYLNPGFLAENKIISKCILQITSGIRFKSEERLNYSKILTNLIPYPLLNSLCFTSDAFVQFKPYTTIEDKLEYLCDNNSLFANINYPPENYKNISTRLFTRDHGDIDHNSNIYLKSQLNKIIAK